MQPDPQAMRIQKDVPLANGEGCMNTCTVYDCTVRMIVKNNKYKKEWHNETKPSQTF